MGRGRGKQERKDVLITRCEDLQPRHREILHLLSTNRTIDQIAGELKLSPHTIRHYVSTNHAISIFPLIGVDNRIDAIIWYVRHCLDSQQQPPQIQESPPEAQQPLPEDQEEEPRLFSRYYFSHFRILLTVIFVSVLLFIFVPLQGLENVRSFPHYYSNIFALIPAIAGIYGLRQYWQLTNDNGFRRIIWWLSVGLILWAVGQVLWVLAIAILGDDVPFPSAADAGYISAAICLVIGIYILRQELVGDTHQNQYIAAGVSGILLTVSIIATFWARGGKTDLEGDPLKMVLDIAYPAIDMVAFGILISIIRAPSFQTLDSQIQWLVYITTLGILTLYIADASFSVTTSLPEGHEWAFYNGSPPDVVFTTAFWILGLAITWVPEWYRSRDAEA